MTRLFARPCSHVALGLFRALDGDRLTGMATDDLKRLRDAVWPPDDVIDGIFREEVDAELNRRGEALYCETAFDRFNKRVERAKRPESPHSQPPRKWCARIPDAADWSEGRDTLGPKRDKGKPGSACP